MHRLHLKRTCKTAVCTPTVLADPRVVHTDVVVTQSEAGDEATGWQVHLRGDTHEVRRVEASLSTLLGAVTIADLAQCLRAERHRVGQVHERPTDLVTTTPHTCQQSIVTP